MFTEHDVVGIILGFGFLFVVLGVAATLSRCTRLQPFVIRKIVHISVAHWWLIALYFHDSVLPALVGPVVFVVLNYLDYRRSPYPGLSGPGSRGGIGTVVFPISLVVIVVLTFGGVFRLAAGTAGVFVMGYGDGLAALVGRRFGGRRVCRRSSKTLLGSVTMFSISSLVLVITLALQAGEIADPATLAALALLVAGVATFIEMATPYDLDNFTVPVVVTILVGVLLA